MINTATQEYITVTSNLTTSRGWFQVILNYYINGKRKQKWRSLGLKDIVGNKNLAKKKQKEVERQFEEELNTPKEEVTEKLTDENLSNSTNNGNLSTEDIGNMLYGDYLLKVWLPYARTSIEETSYSGYESKIKISAKYFNNLGITLNNLTRTDIKKFYLHLQETRNIKNKTINRYHANIHKSLEDAISEFEVIDVNPAHGLRKKEETFIPAYYKLKELEVLFEKAEGNLIELHVLLASYYRFQKRRSMWS